MCVPTSSLESIGAAVDEIYDQAWDWFLNSRERKAAFYLTPSLENAFALAMGCRREGAANKSLFNSLCPVSVKILKRISSRYAVISVSATNGWAFECINSAIASECRLDALAWQSVTTVAMVQPCIFLPLSLVKALVGSTGRTIRSIESHVNTKLHILPIGDTAGTHAIFVSKAVKLSRRKADALRRIVCNILAHQWIPVDRRDLYAFDWYRIRSNGTLVANGCPLKCVRFEKNRIEMRDHEGTMFYFDRSVDAVEAFAL